jgi:lactate racemase
MKSIKFESIINPMGMKPIVQQVNKGSKVVTIFPDQIKGGFQENSHRKISIPIIISQCISAGVLRKVTKEEIKIILGDEIFNNFWWSNQITNHDSEDWDNLVDLGSDEMGDTVLDTKTRQIAVFS